jgi:protein-L-isoaspartate(D-aspartate) O-methyltransferase
MDTPAPAKYHAFPDPSAERSMDQPEPQALVQARREMVEHQLRGRDITDARVLSVMSEIPRQLFVPPAHRASAYEDRALPITCDQTISQPYMVALMTQVLQVDPAHRVLEIGTGSGYQAAVLAELVSHVYTIERIDALVAEARLRLEALGITNVTYHVGDGTLGWPAWAPYDRILVTAGAPTIPQPLIDQLVDGGLLVVPVGGADEQILTVVQKLQQRTVERPTIPCRFVKLIGQEGWS